MLFRNLVTSSIAIVALAGCVVGQKLPMDYAAEAVAVDEANSVRVQVTDRRPYVLSGDKEPSFIGKYRAGFGNPWDVSTEGDVPLADVLAADLVDAVRSEGFQALDAAADRDLAVEIREWNFDGYQNGRFWYDLSVSVLGADGQRITTRQFKDETVVSGTFWGGAKAGFEKAMPGLYRDVVAAIIGDDAILEALREPAP